MKKLIFIYIVLTIFSCNREHNPDYIDNIFFNTKWNLLSLMNINRADAVGVTYNNKGYIISGVDNLNSTDGFANASRTSSFLEFDLQTYSIKNLGNFPGANRKSAFGFVLNDKLYFGGGLGMYQEYLSDFWEYSFTENKWLQKKNLPFAIASPVCLVNKDAFVGIGRIDNNTYLNFIYKYNISNDSWNQITQFPGKSRYNSSSFTVNNSIFIIGGYTDYEYFSDVWEYQIDLRKWIKKNDFKGGKIAEASAFMIKDSVYLAMGINENIAYQNTLFRYSYKDDYWSNSYQLFGNPKSKYCLFNNYNSAIFVGGYYFNSNINYDDVSNEIWIYKQN